MEVYDPATSDLLRPFRPDVAVTEQSVDPALWPVRPSPSGGSGDEATDYAEGSGGPGPHL
ncbi:hypothetical protein GCM10023075_75860 [Streptosporangium album]